MSALLSSSDPVDDLIMACVPARLPLPAAGQLSSNQTYKNEGAIATYAYKSTMIGESEQGDKCKGWIMV